MCMSLKCREQIILGPRGKYSSSQLVISSVVSALSSKCVQPLIEIKLLRAIRLGFNELLHFQTFESFIRAHSLRLIELQSRFWACLIYLLRAVKSIHANSLWRYDDIDQCPDFPIKYRRSVRLGSRLIDVMIVIMIPIWPNIAVGSTLDGRCNEPITK